MENYLREVVEKLAKPGFREAKGPSWPLAMAQMNTSILELGYTPTVKTWMDHEFRVFKNFMVSITGKNPKKIILGAHYDTFDQTPGADDNASAVAVALGVLKTLSNGQVPQYNLEVVFYACEEPPFFGTDAMGSHVHASNQVKDDIACMICLEMVGYFSDEKNSQDFPFFLMKWLYGSTGNFILGVSNHNSRKPAKKIIRFLQNMRPLFYKKLIPPIAINGLDWSDHKNYWSRNIPAIMLTDTAMFRNKNYHTAQDTPQTLDYRKMRELVEDLTQLFLEIKME